MIEKAENIRNTGAEDTEPTIENIKRLVSYKHTEIYADVLHGSPTKFTLYSGLVIIKFEVQ